MTLPLEAVLLGDSPAMVRLRRDITRLAPTEISILVEGETGTGKELVATALHTLSGRRGTLVPVNVAAIPDGLFESQLFGHRRGAFSGAVSDQRGFIEEASGGTLFLDEIASAPIHGQPKLLRVLEARRFRPLGATSERAAVVRVVAASNVPLHSEVFARRFREDLYFRLCGDRLLIPPLRDRRGDIDGLARHYVGQAAAIIRRPTSIAAEALDLLRRYDWPGNVRQLRTVIERAVISVEGDSLGVDDIRRVLERVAPIWVGVGKLSPDATALLDVLERGRWDTTRVAEELGVTRKTIYARIRRLGIAIPEKFHRRGGVENSMDRAGEELARAGDSMRRVERVGDVVAVDGSAGSDVRHFDPSMQVGLPEMATDASTRLTEPILQPDRLRRVV